MGHIFKLGTKYSEKLGCLFTDEAGEDKPMIMGCYGVGIGRTVAAAIEQNHDKDGIIWPRPLAPFEVLVIAVNPEDETVRRTAEDLYGRLLEKASKSSSTTATSARESNSRTPISSESLSA